MPLSAPDSLVSSTSRRPRLVLASNSPRRRQLLTDLGLSYQVRLREVDESFPAHLVRAEVAEYLAAHKAAAYAPDLAPDELLITADTIVCLENDVLNKPADAAEAVRMLQRLQGRAHEVYTGVCLLHGDGRRVVFSDQTRVHFRPLTLAEIEHYVAHYSPLDKAGAYGAQDWIGMVAVTRLEGSYFNVMGLPVHRVWEELVTLGAVGL
ncbi:Maf family nucleotide pyrophosphatase [Hymenobacter sp. 5516J-16]|uniref:dTTP/UTP pyrophosphatase n=1 Tax=Hymenobacter sublimis TaxID=2933777 RepID=A0ABY4JGA2_9BACT|nr:MULTISPECIES: Maf family nucleotide pyrophosphatase [Hymenobacter]UOQ77265.1 Maf family nucleotide pyrophosphatase [Hymenobacter sp. 5516J-16]UPL50937.1 Maf family nucleotide pyrophosphatase [Hymenobacter sublimis]